jgi:hypothetical protein
MFIENVQRFADVVCVTIIIILITTKWEVLPATRALFSGLQEVAFSKYSVIFSLIVYTRVSLVGSSHSRKCTVVYLI